MADSYVGVPADGPGKKIDSSQLAVGAQTVQRQRIVIADNSDAAGFLPVDPDHGIPVHQTRPGLTPAAPAAATVGTSSAQAVASNANRKGLVLTNTSNGTISFGLGATAVLMSGITLGAGGVWQMDETTFTTGAINAIASVAGCNLAVQEFS